MGLFITAMFVAMAVVCLKSSYPAYIIG